MQKDILHKTLFYPFAMSLRSHAICQLTIERLGITHEHDGKLLGEFNIMSVLFYLNI